MLAPWIVNEMKTASLCDKRLNARLENILDQLGSRPTGSIPSACGGYAETAAAYRFFDNDRVTFDNVFQPHIDATRRRIEEQPVVIMVQDTTELDLTRPQQQVAGTGPMDGSSRRGMFMHLLHALTPEGTPLGTAHDQLGARGKHHPVLEIIKASASLGPHRTEGKLPVDHNLGTRSAHGVRATSNAVRVCGRQ